MMPNQPATVSRAGEEPEPPVTSSIQDNRPPVIPHAAHDGPRGSLARDAYWVAGGRFASMLGAALVAFLIPRRLTPAEAGQFFVAQNVLGLGALVAVIGLPLAIIRLLSKALANRQSADLARSLRQAFQVLAVSSIVVSAGTLGWLYLFGPSWLQLPQEPAFLAAFVVAMLVLAWQWFLVEATRGLGEIRLASLFAGGQSGGPAATLLFATALAVGPRFGSLSVGFAMWSLAGALAFTMPAVIWAYRSALRRAFEGLEAAPPIQGDDEPARRDAVLAICIPICLTQLLAYCTLAADLPIAGAFCASQDVALLAQARRLLLLLQMPAQLAAMTILPAAARLYAANDFTNLQALMRRAAAWTALAAAGPALALLLLPSAVLGVLFGDYYRAGAPLLQVLAIGQLVAVYSGTAGYLLVVAGQQQAVVVANAATAVVMVCGGCMAAAWGGIHALAIVSAVAIGMQSAIERWLARRTIGIHTQLDWGALSSALLSLRPTRSRGGWR